MKNYLNRILKLRLKKSRRMSAILNQLNSKMISLPNKLKISLENNIKRRVTIKRGKISLLLNLRRRKRLKRKKRLSQRNQKSQLSKILCQTPTFVGTQTLKQQQRNNRGKIKRLIISFPLSLRQTNHKSNRRVWDKILS